MLTPGSFEVTGSISDAQIGQVVIGQAARITPAGASEALNGRVTSVGEVATVTSGVATFPVTVTIDGVNPALRAGTSASIEIIVNQVSQVLTVPTSAVHTAGSASTVQVLAGGNSETRVVQVGASDAQRTQILSGINPGDQVIIATITRSIPTTGSGNGIFGGGRGLGRGGGGGPVFIGGGG
jgi:hypothetical protein